MHVCTHACTHTHTLLVKNYRKYCCFPLVKTSQRKCQVLCWWELDLQPVREADLSLDIRWLLGSREYLNHYIWQTLKNNQWRLACLLYPQIDWCVSFVSLFLYVCFLVSLICSHVCLMNMARLGLSSLSLSGQRQVSVAGLSTVTHLGTPHNFWHSVPQTATLHRIEDTLLDSHSSLPSLHLEKWEYS